MFGKAFFSAVIFCAASGGAGGAEPLFTAAVSIPAQKYVAEAVSGGFCGVVTAVGKSDDPHIFEPTPRLLSEIGKCRVYFTLGLPFESKLTAKVPEVKTEFVGRSNSSSSDPHVWTCPEDLKSMAGGMCDAFCVILPEKKVEFRKNYAGFCEEMDALSTEIRECISKSGITAFASFHPAWSGFAGEFGIKQIVFEKNGAEPGMKRLTETCSEIEKNGICSILVRNAAEARKISYVGAKCGAVPVIVDIFDEDPVKMIRAAVEVMCRKSGGEATGM